MHAGERVHGVSQLLAAPDPFDDARREGHGERAARPLPAVGTHHDGPGARAHAAIFQLDHSALESDAERPAERLTSGHRPRAGAADRLLVPDRLVGHA